MNEVHYSSISDEWETPQWLYDELDKEFCFGLDAACTKDNAKDHFVDDPLNEDWKEFVGEYAVFCNPPYSRGNQIKFIDKAVYEQSKGVTSVFLIPARTDTKLWHTYIWDDTNNIPKDGVEVRFIKGRLKFELNGKPVLDRHGRPQSAPFPSAIVIFHGV